MYFEKGGRYFDRRGEYEVVVASSLKIAYFYIADPSRRYFGDAEAKRVIDINMRSDRHLSDFVEYCREHGSIYSDVPTNQTEKFALRYKAVTGLAVPKKGSYVRPARNGKTITLRVVIPAAGAGQIPKNLLEHACWHDKEKTFIQIYHNDFCWSLFAQGLQLGSKHRKAVKEQLRPQETKITFGLAYGVGKDKLLKKAKELTQPVYEGFGRLRNPDGSISPVEDTGFRFRRAA